MIRAVLPAGHFVCRVRGGAAEVLVAVPAGYDQSSGRGFVIRTGRRDLRATRLRSGTRRRTGRRTIQLDTGEEAHVARVSVGDARQTGHDVLQALGGVADGQIQQHARTRADPQQVLAGQQGGDAQARGLVLPDDVVAGGQHLIHRVAHVYLEEQLVAEKIRRIFKIKQKSDENHGTLESICTHPVEW